MKMKDYKYSLIWSILVDDRSGNNKETSKEADQQAESIKVLVSISKSIIHHQNKEDPQHLTKILLNKHQLCF